MDDHLEPDKMDGQQEERRADEGQHERSEEERYMEGDEISEGALEVVEYPPPIADGPYDRREVVIEQDEVGRFTRDLRAATAHGDPDIRLAQRRRVVRPVTGHRDDIAVLL